MSHPSVTTYRIEGPANNASGGSYQDNRERDSPNRSRQKQVTKLSKAHLYDQNTTTQATTGRNTMMPTQYQPSRGRAYSNGQPPPQNRPSTDVYGQTGASGRLNDRALPPVPAIGLWSILDQLPQPADDRTITGLVQQVFFLVDQFVGNHYRDLPGQTMGSDPDFENTKFPYLSDGDDPADVLFLLAHSTIAIRHCIMHMLFSCISFDNSSNVFLSFLPPEFTVTESALTRSRPQIDDCDVALSAHRVLLSYLRTDVFQDVKYQEHLEKAMEKMRIAIGTVFSPWREPQSSDDIWMPAFTALMKTTAQLGILLFAQPSTFRFVWLEAKSYAKGDRTIEVHPRLLKINDEQARELNPVQLMLNTKAQRTYCLNDDEVQRILLDASMNRAIALNSGEFGQSRSPQSDAPYQNTSLPQRLHAGSRLPPTPSTHTEPDAIELPTNSSPQLAELSATGKRLSRELNESFMLDGQAVGQNHIDRFHAPERQADEIHNGTPRSPMRNASTRDAYSQQMQQRQQITSCPPSASLRQFVENPLPERKRSKSSKHRRSSSASSETRGRSGSLSVPTPRRASISNDRASMLEYNHRTPPNMESLQSATSNLHEESSSQMPSNGTTGRALPAPRNLTSRNNSAGDLTGKRSDDQRSISNKSPDAFPPTQSKLSQRKFRGGEKSGWKFWKSKNG